MDRARNGTCTEIIKLELCVMILLNMCNILLDDYKM